MSWTPGEPGERRVIELQEMFREWALEWTWYQAEQIWALHVMSTAGLAFILMSTTKDRPDLPSGIILIENTPHPHPLSTVEADSPIYWCLKSLQGE